MKKGILFLAAIACVFVTVYNAHPIKNAEVLPPGGSPMYLAK